MIEFEYEGDSVRDGQDRLEEMSRNLLLSLLVFCLWFVAGTVLVAIMLRLHPRFAQIDPYFREKFALLNTLAESSDQVFLGTSRVHRHVDTEITANVFADQGCGDIEILNLGVGGASSSNIKFLLETVLSKNPDIDRVWLEYKGVDQWETVDSARNALFAPRNPYMIWSDVYGSGGTSLEQVERRKDLSLLSLKSLSNYGAGHALISEGGQNIEPQSFGVAGYLPLDEFMTEDRPRPKALARRLKNQPTYFEDKYSQARASARRNPDARYDDLSQRVETFLSGLSKKELSKIGIVLSIPTQDEFRTLTVKGQDLPILRTPISEYPWLSDSRLYKDVGHLNTEGAKRYSKIIGEQMCERLQGEGN